MNGGAVEIIGDFPFMLSLVEAFIEFFSRIECYARPQLPQLPTPNGRPQFRESVNVGEGSAGLQVPQVRDGFTSRICDPGQRGKETPLRCLALERPMLRARRR